MADKKGPEPTTTVAVHESPKSLKDWLSRDKFKEAVASSLPSHMTPDRFIRVALTALMKTPKLADCTQASIFKVMLDLSSIGLEPDGRRAHIIPYGNTATLIIDYKGLIELAKRNGDVALWRPVAVKANDKFSWHNGNVEHTINWLADRGKLVAVYSHVRDKNGTDDYEVMTLAECEAIRKRSKTANAGPWVTDYEAMCLKCSIRRHSKRLVLSPEFRDALSKDGDGLIDSIQVDSKPYEAGSRTLHVLDKLKTHQEPLEDAVMDDDVPEAELPEKKIDSDVPAIMREPGEN